MTNEKQPDFKLGELKNFLHIHYRKKLQIMQEQAGESDEEVLEQGWLQRPTWPEYDDEPSFYDRRRMDFLRKASVYEVFAAGIENYIDFFEDMIADEMSDEGPRRFDLEKMLIVPL